MDEVRYRYRLAMIPFPSRGWVFIVGVLGVIPSLGVSGFVLGVVVRVGYRPTGSSDGGKQTPFPGAPPQAPNTPVKQGLINLSSPRSGANLP